MVKPSVSLFARLVGATLMLVASVTLAAIALHGWQLHRATRTAQQRALGDLTHLGAVQLTQAADAAIGEALISERLLRQFDAWGWAITRQPAVLATALRDDRGLVRSVWPREVNLYPVLAEALAERESVDSARLEWNGHQTRVWVATCPLGGEPGLTLPADLVVVARRPDFTAAWLMWVLAFALPLAGVATICFIIGLRWLQQRVRDPLLTLLRNRHEQDTAWLARLPTDRRDEVGGIARGTEEILGELCEARTRLARLQRSLNTQVAERTREIKGMLRDAQRQAWVDPLTRLGNRRLLDDRLESVFRAQAETDGELTVVMFDVDHFKQHNDTMGHAAGDELLRFFGQLLLSSLRETDIGIRYAGDEFVVLLLNVGPNDAASMATRIVRLFAQHTSVLATKPQATLSAGVASIRLCGVDSGQELIACADAALYQAKGRGKNCVCTWASVAPRPARQAR